MGLFALAILLSVQDPSLPIYDFLWNCGTNGRPESEDLQDAFFSLRRHFHVLSHLQAELARSLFRLAQQEYHSRFECLSHREIRSADCVS